MKMRIIKTLVAIIVISNIAIGCGNTNAETAAEYASVVAKSAETEDESVSYNKENGENKEDE